MENSEKETGDMPQKGPDLPRLDPLPDGTSAFEDANVEFSVSLNANDDDDDDSDDSEREDLKPLKRDDSPLALLQQGRVVIPHYPQCTGRESTGPAHVCRSQGTIGLQVHGQPNSGLIWIGSSQHTMHQVPIVHKSLKQAKGSYNSVNEVHRSPSLLSSKKMLSSRYSSLTVSECGTDMCSICRICQMPDDEHDHLISPCRCTGSLRYVHTSCLKVSTWALNLYIHSKYMYLC